MTELAPGVAHIEREGVASGHGSFEVAEVQGKSTVTSLWASSPLKLLAPRPRGQSVWIYSSSFGGGFVAGDETSLKLRISDGTRCFFSTQAATKIYRNPAQRRCSHRLVAEIGDDALFVLAPDPVQAFAGSSYSQRQDFHLSGTASLVLVDWYCSGRAARGERWAFTRLHSRNQINVAGRCRLVDALRLDQADSLFASPHRVGRFNCFGVIVLLGNLLRNACAQSLAEVADQPVQRNAASLVSASPLEDGAILRFAGESVETVAVEIRRHLAFLPALLGDDPLSRKW